MKRDYVYIRYECGHVLAVPKAKAEIYAVGQYAVCNICAEVALVKETLNANVAKKKGAIKRKSSAMYRRQAINIEIIGCISRSIDFLEFFIPFLDSMFWKNTIFFAGKNKCRFRRPGSKYIGQISPTENIGNKIARTVI